MPLIAGKILIGFVVGTLIGMTGLGGGVFCCPSSFLDCTFPPLPPSGRTRCSISVTKIGSSLDAPAKRHGAPQSCGGAGDGQHPGFDLRGLAL